MATHLLQVRTPPIASASLPTASVMGCAGLSHMDAAPKVSLGGSAMVLLALLERPSVASLTVMRVMIVLISRAILRVVSDLVLVLFIVILSNGMTVGGGCTVASPFGGNVADGKNCKDIPHVEKVLCDNGSCKVLSCKSGFIVSDSHDSCVKARLNRVRRAQGVGIIDEVLGLLVRQELLVRGFDILAAKEDLLASVQVLDYDHVLKALLAEGAIVGITDLLKLKEVLGLGVSVLRREITDLDSLLDLIVKQGLFVDGFDILAAKENLLAVLKVFDVSHVLELLLLQNAFVDIHDLLTLKDRLGLDFTILRRDVVYTVGGILGLLLKEDLIVGFHDLLTLKEFLGIKIDALDVDSLLKLLIVEGLIVKIIDIVALKQFLGLGVNVL